MDIFILTVSYNAGDALLKTVRSILEQDDPGWRLIVKDGGSTDSSVEELRALVHDDSRVHICVSRDNGIYDAMNMAVDELKKLDHESSPEDDPSYVLFLGCGDILADNSVISHVREAINGRVYLEKVEKNSEDSSPVIFYGDVLQVQTMQRISSNPRLDDYGCYRNVPCHQACLYDERLLFRYPFDTTWKVRADYEQFLRMRYKGKARTFYIRLLIACYEGGGFSESPENLKISEDERKRIIGMYLPRGKVMYYDFLRLVTFSHLRTRLAESPLTSGFYNSVKRFIYDRRS